VVSCIVLQHDERNQKGKGKAKVVGNGKGKSRLGPDEVGNPQSSPNKPSSQDWAISDSEESEPIPKVKRRIRKMSVISEGDEDDDDDVEMALEATDANDDDDDDANDDDDDDANEVDDQCPSSVPNAQAEKHEYLYDLCNYTAYHKFVDVVFETTVSVN
jgi:hypothetical protein